jgi:glutamine---fructose-6-phosphate transaminase (isomerizing)
MIDPILAELLEIPAKAKLFWDNSPAYRLPLGIPYLGMGSSYFAPLAFKYMGVEIYPEIAADYFYYLQSGKPAPLAVILSQSGQSSESVWCTGLFDGYYAITNHVDKALGKGQNLTGITAIMAGEENYSSSKTFVNTLLALYKGFGMDVSHVVNLLQTNFERYRKIGEDMANQVYNWLQEGSIHGIYVIGSGPNYATAMEAALILSESTKRNFHGLSLAQYDHGPKETAKDSIVIQILSQGPTYSRSMKLAETLTKAGAKVLQVEEPELEENHSVPANIIPFNFMAYTLSKRFDVGEMFAIGGKVTEVE